MVFQNYALWPHLSVGENILFGLDIQGLPTKEKQKQLDETLALVELSGYAERRIGELSGGQQQRVALARAIILKPKVLLLDEPLSNLDYRLRGEMRRTIRRVCKTSGVTAVYVTHDQNEALSTADRIALMVAGRIEQIGTPRELYEAPRTQAVASFVGEANLLKPSECEQLGFPGISKLFVFDLNAFDFRKMGFLKMRSQEKSPKLSTADTYRTGPYKSVTSLSTSPKSLRRFAVSATA
jgi:ABC-type Fe3+/spermidine/putrescine transport system ATPase subunit